MSVTSLENSPKAAVGPYYGSNITTKTGTLLKTGQGLLHTVTINTKGAAANTLSIYDGVDNTGTLLATIDTTVAFGSLIYDIGFLVGLYIVSATGTQADITVSWR